MSEEKLQQSTITRNKKARDFRLRKLSLALALLQLQL